MYIFIFQKEKNIEFEISFSLEKKNVFMIVFVPHYKVLCKRYI